MVVAAVGAALEGEVGLLVGAGAVAEDDAEAWQLLGLKRADVLLDAELLSEGEDVGAEGMGVAARVIDSPRERLIAIITNNFSLCNGRWPTQILISSIFIGALAPPYLAGIISALGVLVIALLGGLAWSWRQTAKA